MKITGNKKAAALGLMSRQHLSVISLLLCILMPSFVHANSDDNWWFNIELIAFKRDMIASNDENFDAANFKDDFTKASHLLYLQQIKQTNPLHPVLLNLPVCGSPDDMNIVNVAETPSMNISGTNTRVTKIENQPTIKINKLSFNPLASELQIDEVVNAIQDLEVDAERQTNEVAEPTIVPADENTFLATSSQEQLDNRILQLEQELELVLANLRDIQQQNTRIDCLQDKSITLLHDVNEINQQLVSNSPYFTDAKHVLAKEELVMVELANKTFNQRDLQGLLHTAWRENVRFGAENADFVRVLAGERLVIEDKLSYEEWLENYEYQAELDDINNVETSEENFFAHLQKALAQNDNVDWLQLSQKQQTPQAEQRQRQSQFELDGIFKVYLDYVNQVPYLHIESEFKHYKLEIDEHGKSQLVEFPFKQRRRIISKQIHYFDHPAFGIIVRLERFTPPEPNQQNANTLN